MFSIFFSLSPLILLKVSPSYSLNSLDPDGVFWFWYQVSFSVLYSMKVHTAVYFAATLGGLSSSFLHMSSFLKLCTGQVCKCPLFLCLCLCFCAQLSPESFPASDFNRSGFPSALIDFCRNDSKKRNLGGECTPRLLHFGGTVCVCVLCAVQVPTQQRRPD